MPYRGQRDEEMGRLTELREGCIHKGTKPLEILNQMPTGRERTIYNNNSNKS